MPELPDVTVYIEALRARVIGRILRRAVVRGPFLLRSVSPPAPALDECEGARAVGARRLGKRIVLELEGDLSLVLHLMIAGRLRWKDGGVLPAGRIGLAAFQFGREVPEGTLLLTEAGTKRRASLHIIRGASGLRALDPGGVEPLACGLAAFGEALRRENHTVKRSLTDPRLLSGIGNAYSDEILHAARMSPLRMTGAMSDDEIARLFEATRSTLTRWTAQLLEDFGLTGGAPGRFPGPGQITAFRPGFAVHGKFGRPCPVCGSPVQRIVYAENETNYCATCQTGGRVLADRSLSRLLKNDWPRTIEELEPGP